MDHCSGIVNEHVTCTVKGRVPSVWEVTYKTGLNRDFDQGLAPLARPREQLLRFGRDAAIGLAPGTLRAVGIKALGLHRKSEHNAQLVQIRWQVTCVS